MNLVTPRAVSSRAPDRTVCRPFGVKEIWVPLFPSDKVDGKFDRLEHNVILCPFFRVFIIFPCGVCLLVGGRSRQLARPYVLKGEGEVSGQPTRKNTYVPTLFSFPPINPDVSKASSTSPAPENAVYHLSLSLASKSSPSIPTLKPLGSSRQGP